MQAHVYPNPSTDVLHIVSPGQKDLRDLSLLSITGNRILSRSFSHREQVLDIKAIPAGTYLLAIQYRDGETVYEKIVKR